MILFPTSLDLILMHNLYLLQSTKTEYILIGSKPGQGWMVGYRMSFHWPAPKIETQVSVFICSQILAIFVSH